MNEPVNLNITRGRGKNAYTERIDDDISSVMRMRELIRPIPHVSHRKHLPSVVLDDLIVSVLRTPAGDGGSAGSLFDGNRVFAYIFEPDWKRKRRLEMVFR
jgi:hypothetical protein